MDELQPPFRLIAEALKGGRVVPFLGAGASFGIPVKGAGDNDRLPSGSGLAERLAIDVGLPGGRATQPRRRRPVLRGRIRAEPAERRAARDLPAGLRTVPAPFDARRGALPPPDRDDELRRPDRGGVHRPSVRPRRAHDRPELHGRLLWWPAGAERARARPAEEPRSRSRDDDGDLQDARRRRPPRHSGAISS